MKNDVSLNDDLKFWNIARMKKRSRQVGMLLFNVARPALTCRGELSSTRDELNKEWCCNKNSAEIVPNFAESEIDTYIWHVTRRGSDEDLFDTV